MPTTPARFLYLTNWLYGRRLITGALRTKLDGKITRYRALHAGAEKRRLKTNIEKWGAVLEEYRRLNEHKMIQDNTPVNTFAEITALVREGLDEELTITYTLLNTSDEFYRFARDDYSVQNADNLEELYAVVEAVREATNQYSSVILTYDYAVTGIPKCITVRASQTDTYQRFASRVENIITGNYMGSGALGEDYVLNTTKLSFYRLKIVGDGKADNITFCHILEARAQKGDPLDKYCLYKCLLMHGLEIDKETNYISDDVDRLLKDENYKLELYADYPKDLSRDALDFLANDEKIEVNDCYYKKIKFNELIKISDYGDLNADRVIKLVVKNNHFMILTGKRDDVYIELDTGNITHYVENKEGEKIMKIVVKRKDFIKTTVKQKTQKAPKMSKALITFDYETIFNASYNNELRPYCVFYSDRSLGGTAPRAPVKKLIFGFDNTKKMINDLRATQANRRYTLCGFNNCHFDNWFLIKEMANVDWLDDVFYNKNMILNVKFGGRHNTFDISRFTPAMALKDAGKAFKCTNLKVEGFEHKVIQEAYNKDNNLNHYFHDKKCEYYNYEMTETYEATDEEKICDCDKFNKLFEYNKFDVLTTEELTIVIKYLFEENKMTDDEKSFTDYKTIGSIIYHKFSIDTAKNNIILPLLDLEKYTNVRSGLVAGRTQCYKNIEKQILNEDGKPIKIRDIFSDMTGQNKYVLVDVVSLYPYIMLNRDFPCGKVIDIDYNECMKQDLIGFYETTYSQENLDKNILPLRDEKGLLDWNYKGEIKQYLSTVDIAQLKKYGCKCDVGVGFAFSEKIEGKKLFECINVWKKIKEDEDKKKGTAQYNEALRTLAKIVLNSLSGKVIEGLHCEQIKYIKTLGEFEKYSENNDIELIQKITETKGLIKYTRPEEKAIKGGNRPIYLGVLIYAYARSHMYDNIISKQNIIYQDTDSGLIPLDELEQLKQRGLIGKEFGQFSIEDKEFIRDDDGELISKKEFDELQNKGERTKGEREVIKKYIVDKVITIAPKNYFLFMGDNLFKQGFKGINMLRDKLINKSELAKYFKIRIDEKGKRREIKDKKKILTGEEKHNIEKKRNIDNFNYYEEIFKDRNMKKMENINKFIEILTNKDKANNKAYILTSSIEKNKYDKESKQAGLYQRYTIKEIS